MALGLDALGSGAEPHFQCLPGDPWRELIEDVTNILNTMKKHVPEAWYGVLQAHVHQSDRLGGWLNDGIMAIVSYAPAPGGDGHVATLRSPSAYRRDDNHCLLVVSDPKSDESLARQHACKLSVGLLLLCNHNAVVLHDSNWRKGVDSDKVRSRVADHLVERNVAASGLPIWTSAHPVAPPPSRRKKPQRGQRKPPDYRDASRAGSTEADADATIFKIIDAEIALNQVYIPSEYESRGASTTLERLLPGRQGALWRFVRRHPERYEIVRERIQEYGPEEKEVPGIKLVAASASHGAPRAVPEAPPVSGPPGPHCPMPTRAPPGPAPGSAPATGRAEAPALGGASLQNPAGSETTKRVCQWPAARGAANVLQATQEPSRPHCPMPTEAPAAPARVRSVRSMISAIEATERKSGGSRGWMPGPGPAGPELPRSSSPTTRVDPDPPRRGSSRDVPRSPSARVCCLSLPLARF